MSRIPARHRRPVTGGLILASALLFACSGTGGGCAGMGPIPSGRYEGPKTDNAVNIRLSQHGIDYLNTRWAVLMDMFAPGQQLQIPVGCFMQDPPGIAPLIVADQGRPGCTGESCGQMDGKCCLTASDPGCSASIVDAPRQVAVKFTSLKVVPRPTDTLEVNVSLTVDSGKLYIATIQNSGWCSLFSKLKCSIEFNTATPTPTPNVLDVQVRFSIDTKWDKLLSFEVTQINGTKVCGESGALPKPRCLDPNDLDVDGENNCGTLYCGSFDWAPIKSFVLRQISPSLQKAVQDALANQSCQACGDGLPACPQLAGSAASTCDKNRGVCVDTVTGACVPRFLGVEGRLLPSALLGSYGVPADALLDMSVAAGSSVSVDNGLNVGTRAGLMAVNVAECVPTLPPPQMTSVPPPNFDAEATPGSGYHVGVGISKSFLDLAMHHAHQSGTLCLNMSSATVGLINTGLFKTFLPSLGKLATRDGKDAPMMVVLRPGKAPQMAVGEGTYDPVTRKPIKPLLTLEMPDLGVDFYAMIDDRFVRLFSLTADVSIPLSLIFEGCSSVQPALGDLKQLITNIRTANSEILAEDPKVLADLIPAVIGLAEPALASALKPFAMPELGGFKLKVNETKGLGSIAGTEQYHHLGLYAELLPASAQCATGAPTTRANLQSALVPTAEEMKLRGRGLQWPVAILDVGASGMEGSPEFAWRVDGGLWSTFAPAPGGKLEVSHPVFLLQGRHLIEVRSRMAEQPSGVSAPVTVEFAIDWEAPEVRLEADRVAGVLRVEARDVVTATEKLQYAYRVGEGAPSSFGPARPVDLQAVEAAGGLEVQVRDEAGNVGTAVWRVPTIAERPDAVPPSAIDPQAVGCAASGGSAFALWPLIAGAVSLCIRRRRRSGQR